MVGSCSRRLVGAVSRFLARILEFFGSYPDGRSHPHAVWDHWDDIPRPVGYEVSRQR